MGRKVTHGLSGSATYVSWDKMMHRCYNKNGDRYKDYGGRGITVCSEWHLFENFLKDMGLRPDGTSLDRLDVNKGYSKSNCRWATRSEQQCNRRDSKRYLYAGKSLTIAEWAMETGISSSTISKRLNRSKWPIEKALTTGGLK